MKKSECVVYIANIKEADYENLFDAFGREFEPKRLERISKCKNESAKKSLILTGVLLTRALADNGASPSEIGYGSFEKPYLKGRKNLFFNISHSGNYLIIAVAGQEIGADIQKPSAYNENLVNRICSLEERKSREKEIIGNFNRIWALKESFSKLRSEGILMDFSKVYYEDSEQEIKVFLDGRQEAFAREIKVTDDYACFVCAYKSIAVKKIVNVCL